LIEEIVQQVTAATTSTTVLGIDASFFVTTVTAIVAVAALILSIINYFEGPDIRYHGQIWTLNLANQKVRLLYGTVGDDAELLFENYGGKARSLLRAAPVDAKESGMNRNNQPRATLKIQPPADGKGFPALIQPYAAWYLPVNVEIELEDKEHQIEELKEGRRFKFEYEVMTGRGPKVKNGHLEVRWPKA
jgi:hypothetical protein